MPETAKYEIAERTELCLRLRMDRPFKFWGDIDMIVKLDLPPYKMPEIVNKDLSEYLKKIRKDLSKP